MHISQTRLSLRQALFSSAVLILGCVLLATFLPYDHTVRSLARFHWSKVTSLITPPLHQQQWFFKRPQLPVDFREDVGLIIKTGYGTQHRLLAQMDALGFHGTSDSVIVIADFNASYTERVDALDVVDVIGTLLEDNALAEVAYSPRALRYYALQDAITAGDLHRANELGKEHGWELDALKFIPGLELAYKQAPYKRWWIIIDDDTFLVKASMERLLARLDPLQDHYVGNPVGDYRIRFAHGGSAVVVSQRTLAHLFEQPAIVAEAKVKSLTETWGDRLVADTLMKLGVYLDERYQPFFNGFQPRYTRVTQENFCLPIASFHGLSNSEDMSAVSNSIASAGGADHLLFYGAIWPIFEPFAITNFASDPVRVGHDHVGVLDDKTRTFPDITSALDCVAKCDAQPTCLAWTWVEEARECHVAPFVVIGDDHEGRSSGVHFPRAQAMGDRCTLAMEKAGCLEQGADCGV